MKKINLYIGIILFLISLILAFYYRYNHFYEFMLIGLFIIFGTFVENEINKKMYHWMYAIFFFLGLFGDLLLGITIFKLWFYTYESILEYVPLYLIIYPFGGIVMLQTFIILQKIFIKNQEYKKLNYRILKIAGLTLLFLFIFLIIVKNKIFYGDFISYVIGTLGVYSFLEYLVIKKDKISFLSSLLKNPKSYIIITIIGSYSQAIMHEFPNTFAKQWIYQNIPYINIEILGVPVIIFFFVWIFLLIIPTAIYFLIIANQNFKKH